MHELPITQNLLDLILDHVTEAGGGKVTGVHLVVGELSSVIDESVQFYWDIVSEGTPAEGARLHFRHVSLEFYCRACGEVFQAGGTTFECVACHGTDVRVAGGDEFLLEAIDLDPLEAAIP